MERMSRMSRMSRMRARGGIEGAGEDGYFKAIAVYEEEGGRRKQDSAIIHRVYLVQCHPRERERARGGGGERARGRAPWGSGHPPLTHQVLTEVWLLGVIGSPLCSVADAAGSRQIERRTLSSLLFLFYLVRDPHSALHRHLQSALGFRCFLTRLPSL
jgi:hypothetical protein